jgi:hypothetical protein
MRQEQAGSPAKRAAAIILISSWTVTLYTLLYSKAICTTPALAVVAPNDAAFEVNRFKDANAMPSMLSLFVTFSGMGRDGCLLRSIDS